MEKDVHAYLFCATYPGRTLIFVNAIAIARRLSALLCTLNVPATPLHAQMQQRQRLKSLVSSIVLFVQQSFFFFWIRGGAASFISSRVSFLLSLRRF